MSRRPRSSERTNAFSKGRGRHAAAFHVSALGLSEGLIEAGWLTTVVVMPVFFNKYASNAFEPEKIHVLRSLALVILGAWFVKAAASFTERSAANLDTSAFRRLARLPLVLPAAAVIASAILSTALSVAPEHSLWGAFGRSMGTYTLASCWLLFAAVAANVRTRAQVVRLVSAIVLGSVPVSLYAIAQRFDVEPLVVSTRVVEASRVSSTFGSPSFLSAYLTMIVPLALGRAVVALRRHQVETALTARVGELVIQVTVLLLALTAMWLTGSRGALLGLVAGVLVMSVTLAAHARHRSMVGTAAGAAAVFVLLGAGLTATRADTLAGFPTLQRFKEAVEIKRGAGLQRTLLWRIAADAVASPTPLEVDTGRNDSLHPLRSLVGYGPETAGLAMRHRVPPALIAEYGGEYVSPDRAHNQSWDLLLTVGVLGLVAWELLYGCALWLALRWLDLLPRSRPALWYCASVAGGGLACAGVLAEWQGVPLAWLGFRFGATVGLVTLVGAKAWSQRPISPPGEAETFRAVVVAAVCGALVAHAIEVAFSFSIGITEAFTWLYLGLLIASGRNWAQSDASAEGDGWHTRYVGGALGTMVLSTLGFELLTKSGGVSVVPIVAAALTRLPGSANATTPWIAIGIVLIVIIMSSGWSFTDPRDRHHPSFRTIAAATTVFGFSCWAMLAWHLASMPGLTPDRPSSDVALVDGYEQLEGIYYALVAAAVASLAVVLGRRRTARMSTRALVRGWIPAVTAAGVGLAVGAGVYALNLRPSFADIAAAKADQFKASGQWPVVTGLYKSATDSAPFVAFYHEALGNAILQHAVATNDPRARASLLVRAEHVLDAAHTRFPLEAGLDANLGDVYLQRAAGEADPQKRQEDAAQAATHLKRTLALEPARFQSWTRAAYLDLAFSGDVESAAKNVLRSLELQPTAYEALTLSGDIAVVKARRTAGPERERLRHQAIQAYAAALAHAPGHQRSVLNQSLARLYWEMRERETALSYVERALEDSQETVRAQLEALRGEILRSDVVLLRDPVAR